MGLSFVYGGASLILLSLSVVWLYYLWRRNKRLTKRVKTLTDDLSKTAKILIEKNLELVEQNLTQQKLLESKDDFINIVSHQLRAPMTQVKWGLDAILKNPEEKISSSHRESLQKVYASVEHSIRLISDLVHLVRIEQGGTQLAVTAYAPDAIVSSCVEQASKEFVQKNIILSVETKAEGSTVNSIDPDSLEMVVNNLVENAFHYTPSGGKLSVQTYATPEDTYKIIVSDSGIGMSPEQQKVLFTKFKRGADAIQVNAHGSGLGLYIVKKIIEHHKGSVSFTSQKNNGTTFIITLPLCHS